MHYCGLIFFAVIAAVFAQNPIVQTNYGKVKGYAAKTWQGTKFMGIPFAKPPTGNLRFQKPEKPTPWSNTLDGKDMSPSCWEAVNQISEIYGLVKFNASEDCLYLNIYVPGNFENAKSNPKAVMFWIYGGGYSMGNANLYPADKLSSTQDVIVVTFNYRIGLLGFMASEDGSFPGNMGLFDQHAALLWVNQNIAAFGGDTSRITIFGESAGAHSVLMHLVSPMSSNLFSRGILQSLPLMPVTPKAVPFSLIKGLVSSVCPMPNAPDILKCLLDQPVEKINNFSDIISGTPYTYVTIDGEFVIDDPFKLLAEGKFNPAKDVIAGFTTDDGDLMIRIMLDWNRFIKYGLSVFEAKQAISTFPQFYLKSANIPNQAIIENLIYQKYISCKEDPLDIARGIMDLSTDFVFASQGFEVANAFSKFGTGKTYVYEFDHLSNYLKEAMDSNIKLSAGHGYDIPYTFGFDETSNLVTIAVSITPAERMLSRSMMKAFSEFAKTGKPMYLTHKNQTAEWRPYGLTTKEYLHFTSNMTINSSGLIPKALQSRMDFCLNVLPGIHNIHTCDTYFGKGGTVISSKGASHKSITLIDLLLAVTTTVFITTFMQQYQG